MTSNSQSPVTHSVRHRDAASHGSAVHVPLTDAYHFFFFFIAFYTVTQLRTAFPLKIWMKD